MAKRVTEDPFYYCVDAIFMMVSVPNNLNIEFSTCHTNEMWNQEHTIHGIDPPSIPKLLQLTHHNLQCNVSCALPFDTIIWYMHSSLRYDYGFPMCIRSLALCVGEAQTHDPDARECIEWILCVAEIGCEFQQINSIANISHLPVLFKFRAKHINIPQEWDVFVSQNTNSKGLCKMVKRMFFG